MAITATLVFAGHNRLRYLVTSSAGGEVLEIPCVGGATPDLQTDSIAGPIKNISKVKANGYGKIAAGGISTQAQARALWLSDDDLSLVGDLPVTAITQIEQISGNPQGFVVDAIRGVGDDTTPSLQITNTNIGGASCYLDIAVLGAIGA